MPQPAESRYKRQMIFIYKFFTTLLTPLLPLLLRHRLKQGKEDRARIRERLGHASHARSAAPLLWVHAASMGESVSILPLIESFLKEKPHWQVLITSVTLTSAALLASKLPPKAIHQFAPLDNPLVIKRFLNHWQPNAALWVESELWPNMMQQTHQAQIPFLLANARMSARSYRRWQWIKPVISSLLNCFTCIYPQSEQDAARFRNLGATRIEVLGNLKYDAAPLPVEESALQTLKAQLQNRPLWLAASTHAGEEALIAQTHQQLKQHLPNILTFIIPRHAQRGEEIAAMLRQNHAHSPLALRSKNERIITETEFYLADTMGELGLFYRLAPVAFIGGSLVPHGGQNMLEALRLHCAAITGSHTHNFTAIMRDLLAAEAILQINHADELAPKIRYLLENDSARETLLANATNLLTQHHHAMQKLLNALIEITDA